MKISPAMALSDLAESLRQARQFRIRRLLLLEGVKISAPGPVQLL